MRKSKKIKETEQKLDNNGVPNLLNLSLFVSTSLMDTSHSE